MDFLEDKKQMADDFAIAALIGILSGAGTSLEQLYAMSDEDRRKMLYTVSDFSYAFGLSLSMLRDSVHAEIEKEFGNVH